MSDTHLSEPQQSVREIGLKFDLLADAACALLARPPWTSLAPTVIRNLHSVYFDTPDQALRRAGLTLHIRTEDGRSTQTVQTMPGVAAPLVERGAWSCPVSGARPDLHADAAAMLQPVLAHIGDATIGTLFSVTVQRHRTTVVYEGASVEIAVDLCELQAGRRRQTFYELELKLLNGDMLALFSLARSIFAAMPLRLQLTSKAERGFALLGGEVVAAKAAPVALCEDLSVAQAFQTIARSCLWHLVVSEAAFRQSRSAESVHQARVAIRRLRAALSLFRKCCKDKWRDRIGAELRWTATELGAARALDVYVTDVLDPAAPRYDGNPDYLRLRTGYRQRRRHAYQNVAEFLASPRFRYAMLVLAEWIECGQWLQRPQQLPRLREYAARRLDRCWKRVRRTGARYRSLDDAARHAWRIDIKKLRYACEFFSALYGDRGAGKHHPQRQAVRRLGRLQDWLGTLNDIAETEYDNPLSDVARALQRERASRRPGLMRRIDEDYRALAAVLPFWNGRDGEPMQAPASAASPVPLKTPP